MPPHVEYVADYVLSGEIFVHFDEPVDPQGSLEPIFSKAEKGLSEEGVLLANDGVSFIDSYYEEDTTGGVRGRTCYQIEGRLEEQFHFGKGERHILDDPKGVAEKRAKEVLQDRPLPSHCHGVHVYVKKAEIFNMPYYTCFSRKHSLHTGTSALSSEHAADMYVDELRKIKTPSRPFTVIVEFEEQRERRFRVSPSLEYAIEETTHI